MTESFDEDHTSNGRALLYNERAAVDCHWSLHLGSHSGSYVISVPRTVSPLRRFGLQRAPKTPET